MPVRWPARGSRRRGQPAEPPVGVAPRSDRARDRDRQRPAERDRRVSPRRGAPPASARGRRPARTVERELPPGRRVPDQPERVAADPAAARHDHAEHGVRRDRGIHRRPAGAKDREPGCAREVVRRDHRATRSRGRAGPAPTASRRSSRRGHVPRGDAGAIRAVDEVLLLAQCASGRSGDEQQHRTWRAASHRCPASPRRCRRSGCPVIWPIARKTRIETHDRAAISREPFGDVGKEPERRRCRAGQHEQSGRRGQDPDQRARPASRPPRG